MKRLLSAIGMVMLYCIGFSQVIDEFNGSSIGTESGVSFVVKDGRQVGEFRKDNKSRVQYPLSTQIPTSGTLEWWVYIEQGYNYSDYTFSWQPTKALLFTTDVWRGDVTWPGSTWLWVCSDGAVTLRIATSKYDSTPGQSISASGSSFRFNEWHRIGISYGTGGQYLMVDGEVVASNPANTQVLGTGGDKTIPSDIPTVGEAVPHFLAEGRYTGGFEGYVDRFRISSASQDWVLALAEETVSAEETVLSPGTSTYVSVLNSKQGVEYSLIDKSTGNIVGTSQSGTGNTVVLGTGSIAADAEFYIQSNDGTKTELLDSVTILYTADAPPSDIGACQPNDSRLAYWSFDNDPETDDSGNGHTATVNGTIQMPGKEGKALVFDGGNDYLAVNSIAHDIAVPFTIGAWIKYPGSTENGTVFASNTETGDNNFLLYIVGNRMCIHEKSDVTIYGPYVDDDEWHYVAYTNNGTTGELFVDGISYGTSVPIYSFYSAGLWSIGQEWDSSDESDFFAGMIDEVSVFSKALTKAEVQSYLYEKPTIAYDAEICQTDPAIVEIGHSELGVTYSLVNKNISIVDDSAIGDGGTIALTSASLTSATDFEIEADRSGASIVLDTVLSVSVGLCCPMQASKGNIEDGLLAYWSFDDGTATDNSGNERDEISSSNVSYVEVNNGKALKIDASASGTSYINIGNGFDPHVFSISANIRLNSFTTTPHVILSKLNNISAHRFKNFEFRVQSSGQLLLHVPNGSAWNSIVSAQTVPLHEWTNVACSYDGTTAKLYINGALVASRDLEYESDDTDVVIGNRSGYATEDFQYDGLLDEIYFYRNALSQAEIEALMSNDPRVHLSDAEVCSGGSANVVVEHSEPGVAYTLFNNGTGTMIGATQTGDGSDLVFSTGALTATTEFDVKAENSYCAIPLDSVLTVAVGSCCPQNMDAGLFADLVGYYPFDGDARDLSGSGNDGTFEGNPFKDNQLYIPKTIDNAVALPASILNGATDFSVSFTTNIETLTGLNTWISGVTASEDNQLDMIYFSSKVVELILHGSDIHDIPYTLKAGTDYHVSFIRQSGIFKLYIDGELLVSRDVGTKALAISEGALVVGQEQDAVGGGFDANQALGGYMDNLYVFRRALSADEIESLSGPQFVAEVPESICPGESASISLYNTQVGTEYTLYNHSTGDVARATQTGTGGDLAFVVDNVLATTDYDIMIENSYCMLALADPVTVTVGNCCPLDINEYGNASELNSLLKGYWKLDGNALDASRSGNHGTISSTLEVPGVRGSAYAFDGANDYIALGTSNDYARSNNLTVCAWVYSASTSGVQRVFSTSYSRSNQGFGFGQADGKIRFTTFAVKDYETSAILPTGEWVHIAAVFDNDNDVSFYMNGEFVAKVDGTKPTMSTSSYAVIGKLSVAGSSEFWNGSIDEVRYYTRSLSAQEISAIYSATVSVQYDPFICNNASSTITLQNSEKDVEYSFYQLGSDALVGSARFGNGDTLQFATPELATNANFVIKAENKHCAIQLDTTIALIVQDCCPADIGDTTQISNGLAGSWNFDYGIGVDNSGNKRHGTINGASVVDGVNAKALSFDGEDDQFLSEPVTIASNFTLECWFQATATHQIDAVATSGTAGIAGQRYLVYPRHGDALGASAAGAGLSVGTNGISVYEHATDYMPARIVYSATLSGWNHVALVYTNNTPSLYVNGMLVKTGTQSSYTVYASNARFGGGSYGYFQGMADEFRVYDRSLSSSEIQSLVQFRPLSLIANKEACVGTKASVAIVNSEYGTAYQLFDGTGNAVGDAIAGTGGEIVFESDILTQEERFTIKAQNNNCSITLDTVITVASKDCCPADIGNYAAEPSLADGLVLYYDFNDGTATDKSGNSNDGTVAGLVSGIADGIDLQALEFTGNGHAGTSGTHVVLPAIDFSQYGAFSVSMWVNEEGFSSEYQYGESYFAVGLESENGVHIDRTTIAGGREAIRFKAGDRTEELIVPFDVEKDRNTYILWTLVYDNGSVSAYKNGVLLGKNTQSGVSGLRTRNAIAEHWWGTTSSATSTRLIGSVDEVRVYGRALSAPEVEALAKVVPKVVSISSNVCSGESSQVTLSRSEKYVQYSLVDAVSGAIAGSTEIGNGVDITLVSNAISEDRDLAIQATLGDCKVRLDTVFSIKTDVNNVIDLSEELAGLNLGDLDIAGNAITVEAIVQYDGNSGNILSKHTAQQDANYVFRPTQFGINAGGSYSAVANPVALQAGKTYHLAASYNGSSLKYYVNGCEVNSRAVTGSLINNNLDAVVGCLPDDHASERLVGFVDELRIWNVTRAADEIRDNIQGLVDPENETGLVAAYSFNCVDPYRNIAGNADYNASVIGDAFPREENTDVIAGGCCAASLPEAIDIQTGLVGYWNFQGGEASDLTENANNGVVTGAEKVSGQNQDALSFDGASDMVYVTNSTSLQFGTEQTISLWMKVDEFPTDGMEHYILSKHTGWNNGQIGFHLYLSNHDGQDAIIYRNKNGYTSPWGECDVPFSAVQRGEYFHLVYTVTDSEINAYINGRLVATGSGSGTDVGSNAEDLWFGWGKWTADSKHFSGALDEVRLYDRTLREGDVQALFLADHNIYTQTEIVCDDNDGTDIVVENSVDGVLYSLYKKGSSDALQSVVGNGSARALATGALTENAEFEIIANNGECSIPYLGALTVSVGNCCPVDVDGVAEVPSVNDGLMAYWSFDDGTATDLSGNGYNGTIYGATPVAGVKGGALSFDGVNDYVNCGTAVGNFGEEDFSVAYWLSVSDKREVFSKRSACTHTNFFEINSYSFEIDNNGSNYYLGSIGVDNSDGKWHHIVLRRTGKTLQFFFDGVLSSEYSFAGITNLNSTAVLKIGTSVCVGLDGSKYLKGLLDEVRFYTRSISESEINALASISPTLSISNAVLCTNERASVNIEHSQEGVQYKIVDKATDVALSGAVAGTGGTIEVESDALAESAVLKIVASTPVCSIDMSSEFPVTVGGKFCQPANIGDTIVAKDIDKGLIAYWSFDDGTATDNSGNGHDGTKNGGFFFDGMKGKAFLMDGTSDYISVPDDQALRLSGTDFTISSWVYLNEHDPSYSSGIVVKRGAGSSNGYITGITGMQQTDTGFGYMQISGGDNPRLATKSPIALQGWNHLLYTFDVSEETMSVYLNGQLSSTSAGIPAPNAATVADLCIGKDSQLDEYFFSGMLDEIRIYNKALSMSEIQYLNFEMLDVIVENEVPCSAEKPIIKIVYSEAGVEYALFNTATDAFIGAAQIGNGDTLTFTTDVLTDPTTIGIRATDSHASIVLDRTVSFALGSIVTHADSAICFGETAFFEGADQSSSGTYTDTYSSANGCDSIVVTELTVLPEIKTTATATICQGQSMFLEGAEQTVAGIYTDVYQSVSGCDSTVVTELFVLPSYTESEDVAICQGESYEGWDVAGTYQRKLQSVSGCDSVVATVLTVNPSYDLRETVTICQGDEYEGHTVSGEFSRTLVSEQGCDSTITTELTVLPHEETHEDIAICAGENHKGWVVADTYVEDLRTVLGCDSTVTTVLSVLDTFLVAKSVTICNGGSYKGHTEAGAFTEYLIASNGCDSTVVTELSVDAFYKVDEDIAICDGESYEGHAVSETFDRILLAQSGCDSIVTTVLTVNPVYSLVEDVAICDGDDYAGYTERGTYTQYLTTAAGCDSTVDIRLTVTPLLETSDTVIVCKDVDVLQEDVTITKDALTCEVHTSLTITAPKYSKSDTTYTCSIDVDEFTLTVGAAQYYTSVFGCDSVVTRVVAQLPEFTSYDTVSICQGQNFKGEVASGDYTFAGTTVNLCDSTQYVHLTVNPVFAIEEDIAICQGDEYEGHTIADTYVRYLTSHFGCDSTVTTHLSVNPAYRQEETVTICQGEQYDGHSESGKYLQTLKTSLGCDSIIATTLVVLPVHIVEEDVSICKNDSYNGHTDAGIYRDTLLSVSGCDSIVVTTLTVVDFFEEKETIAICEGTDYLGWTEPGNYTRTLVASSGCDSVVTTHLIVNPIDTLYETVTICAGEMHKGHAEPGEYSDTFASVAGCDSVVVTTLRVIPHFSDTVYATICEGESYNGWIEPGEYKQDLETVWGCDSTLYTMLTVLEIDTIYEAVAICAGEEYMGYSESGQFAQTFASSLGCDSVVVTTLNVVPHFSDTSYVIICHGENYNGWTASGEYKETLQSVSGCDSVVTTVLTVTEVDSTSERVSICKGESYEGFSKSGIYERILVSSKNCDSVVTTTLTVFEPETTHEYVSICAGESYEGHTASGVYETVQESLFTGCDSIVKLHLTVNEPYKVKQELTLCYSDTLSKYKEAGIYADTLIAETGCDSIIITTVKFGDSYQATEYVSVCNGESYNGWGASGEYFRTLPSLVGCDSVVRTVLTVNKPETGFEHVFICTGESYDGHSQSGEYSKIVPSVTGCDSMAVTTLTVLQPTVSDIAVVAIEGTEYNGHSQGGNYTDTLQSIYGCDSIVNVALSFKPYYEITTSVAICGGENYNGHTESGVYTDSLATIAGIDSVVITYLTVNATYELFDTVEICNGDSYLGFSESRTITRNLATVTGCDSIVNTRLIVHDAYFVLVHDTIAQGDTVVLAGEKQTIAGVYTDALKTAFGCDSIIETYLVVRAGVPPTVKDTVLDQSISDGGTFSPVDLSSVISDDKTPFDELVWIVEGAEHVGVNIDPDGIAAISVTDKSWFGTDSVTIIAKDAHGNSSSITIGFTMVNHPPVVEPIPNQVIPFGGTFDVLYLDDYVHDDFTADDKIEWTHESGTNILMAVSNNIARIALVNASWYGGESIMLIAKDEGGLADTTFAIFEVEKLLGVELGSEMSVAIAPNPSDGNTSVVFGKALNADAVIEIVDLHGVVLVREKLHAGIVVHDIAVENAACGVYELKIITSEVVSIHKLIIE